MASKTKFNPNDMNYEEDDDQSPMGNIARINRERDSVSNPLATESFIQTAEALKNKEPLPYQLKELERINSLANSEQSVSKNPLAEREPTVSKPLARSVSNSKAKREQSRSNPLAIGEHTVSNQEAEISEEIQSVSNPSPTPLAIREQFVSHQLAEDPVSELVGKEKKLLLMIYEKCESNGSLESPVMTTEDLMAELDVSAERLRNLVFRLKDKNVLTVIKNKSGKGGWRKFYLRKEIFQAIRLSQSKPHPLAIREQTVSNPSSTPLATPLAEAPYSSSNSLNDKNLNTIEVPENLRPFGISAINLQKLVETGKNTLENVTKSLDALSYDVGRGKKGQLANILFGALNKGGEYISQEYAQRLNQELIEELKRNDEALEARRKLAEMALVRKWETYKAENPNWINIYRAKFGPKFAEETLEQFAIEEFKRRVEESS